MKPIDFARVVGANWSKTTGYLVAGSDPCLAVRGDELRNVRRRLLPVHLSAVARLEPEGSWFMGVLVCRGDDLSGLSLWAQGRDHRRVHFYLHARARAMQLSPWRDAGLPLLHVDRGFKDWTSLHKILGWDLNLQVYADHGPR